MDPISDILSHRDFAGMLYFSTEFSGDWGVRVPASENVVRFHLVLTCTAFLEGAQATEATADQQWEKIEHTAVSDL